MADQAQSLRNLIDSSPLELTEHTKVIAVTSGKGGVGKSNFTLNFALALQEKGHKVLVFDADIGLANLDVLMGISPKLHLYHLLKKEKGIEEIVQEGPNGLRFIAGGSGFNDLLTLSEDQLQYFMDEVGSLNGAYDYILFDTGAGLSKETLNFILAAEQSIVVTTPEPTSITDAYAIIKMVTNMQYKINFNLVVNRVTDSREGKATADKISLVARKFLDLDIPTLGYISDDQHVSKAVKKQVPFTIAFPGCHASKDMRELARQFMMERSQPKTEVGMKGFIHRMMRFMKS
ncbi:MinD/ParA family protein [Marinicrinis sediminis]|uniref:MinD/ParA family protein n=1 Tax=Marinicrinis sediminis TaxID=1652465 RepID=A0ABW5R5Q7_9BACL